MTTWFALGVPIAVAGIAAWAGLSVVNVRRRRIEALLEPRLKAYASLWSKFGVTSLTEPGDVPVGDRVTLAAELREWYFDEEAGLLLNSSTQAKFVALVVALGGTDPEDVAEPRPVKKAASALRSELKREVGVYKPTGWWKRLRWGRGDSHKPGAGA